MQALHAGSRVLCITHVRYWYSNALTLASKRSVWNATKMNTLEPATKIKALTNAVVMSTFNNRCFIYAFIIPAL